jgi:hypothetical protein
MRLYEFELERVSWASLRESTGSATAIPGVLTQLLTASTPEECETHYWRLENYVVVQGNLFEVAEFVVPVLLAALQESSPRCVRISILELLFQIVSGGPHQSELALGNFDLARRCQAKTREGIWILYRELMQDHNSGARDVLEVVETDQARLAHYMALIGPENIDYAQLIRQAPAGGRISKPEKE